MASSNLKPSCAVANPIVAAYLAALANHNEVDASQVDPESIEMRTAQFTFEGAEHYAMAWGVHDAEHGALVALLAANRLQYLIDGYGQTNDRDQKFVTFGIEELYEVRQIKDAMLNLWRHLDGGSDRPHHLQPLAVELRLIDQNGNPID